MADDKEQKIEERIQEKNKREDARQRAINVSWSLNCATEIVKQADLEEPQTQIEDWARWYLGMYDRLTAEREEASSEFSSGEQAL